MNSRIVLFFTILINLCFFSCTDDGNKNIQAYYFPIDQLSEGMVYEYQSVGNEYDPPFYWYYRSIEYEGATYLTGMYYDHNFTPFQFVREEVVSNGMLLADFYWYETDTLTGKQNKVDVNVENGSSVFPFKVSNPPGVVISSINWKMAGDSLTEMTFIRNRQYDKDTTFNFRGKELEAISVNVRELIDNNREGHLEQEYPAKEIYAKNIGLIYFEKDIDPQWQMKYALKDTYDMATFEQKFKQNLLPISVENTEN